MTIQWAGRELDQDLLNMAKEAVQIQNSKVKNATCELIQLKAQQFGRKVNFETMTIEYISQGINS